MMIGNDEKQDTVSILTAVHFVLPVVRFGSEKFSTQPPNRVKTEKNSLFFCENMPKYFTSFSNP